MRCHRCEPCTRDDCGECKYCKDMKKFGGTGVSKQCCLSKQCLQPLLPTTTTCMLCEKLIDRFHEDTANLIYECEICFEIFHEMCARKKYASLAHVDAIVNEELLAVRQLRLPRLHAQRQHDSEHHYRSVFD